VCYADSSYADDRSNGRSTTGYVVKMNDGPISWFSKQQSGATHSTSEAEYIAAGKGAMELVYLDELLFCFGIFNKEPMQLFGDNTGCVFMSNNENISDKSRHIRVKYHYIRDLVKEKTITVTYVPTTKMIADILTKAVTVQVMEKLRPFLLVDKT
jgi:hypothetical protein